ncbi:sensor histidine kinase [Persicobacter psychrovividus]|uniref:histidine kinase n=1 Tax=Persicobacter psychrovividus TaxID=387638 RepID=A0ABN6L4F3_9BACT|nr:histidine kinase [Persicobacter psychrovividus]
MEYKSFKQEVFLRIIALSISIFGLAFMVFKKDAILSSMLLLGLIGLQVVLFIRMVEDINNVIEKFNSLKNQPNSKFRFPKLKDNSYLTSLYHSFNNFLDEFRMEPQEQQGKYHYLKNIVQHAGIGLISFDSKGQVEICNAEAKNLLGIDKINHISALGAEHPALRQQIKNLKTGGRSLVKIIKNSETLNLSLLAIELTLNGENFKLISFQNIQSELDQNEMEAWQKLVRVLTHEIMNSITPISSLASTIEGDIVQTLDNCEDDASHCAYPIEDLEDLQMAVRTIQKRGKGLIQFVTDFRSLTKVPLPDKQTISVRALYDESAKLMEHETCAKNIQMDIQIIPDDLKINADAQQLQQVLINLLLNACHAISEYGKIMLSATKDDKYTYLKITDNGCGIEEEALTKIFIPFFTTKKNGSGIGLALSRQIIRQHEGNLSAVSKEGEGTTFTIRLKNYEL